MPESKAKVLVITGAASGIGRALALEALRRGHEVYASDLDVEAMADLKARGIRTVRLDVTRPDDIAGLQQRLRDDGCAPDLLINNAGFGAIAPLAEIPMTRLRAQFEVNVFAIVALCQTLAPVMIDNGGGRIVNIGSVSGVLTTPFAGAYCASKAAVHALSDALRMELKPFGVDVITVQPGGIRSAFGERAAAQVRAVLPEHSRYAAVADSIIGRAQDSQGGAMEADEFARRMLDQVLATKAPHTVRIGKGSFTLPFFKRYAPVRLRDQHLMKRYALDQLGLRP